MPGKRTMTIQTQKPPTLAELRKLAKRKGFPHCRRFGWAVSVRGFGGDDFANINVWFGGPALPTYPVAKRVMFAALSTLPDKERAR